MNEQVPGDNGVMCQVTSIKLKHDQKHYHWKRYYIRKVRTVWAGNIEWVELDKLTKRDQLLHVEERIAQVKEKIQTATKSDAIHEPRTGRL